MRVLYARRHRMSIYEAATIKDIPREVHQKFLLYLLPAIPDEDLVASSLVDRAWYPISQKLLSFKADLGQEEMAERWICGRVLKEIVMGLEEVSLINFLVIDLEFVEREYVPIIAQIVSSNLRTLIISGGGYDVLDEFFSRCGGIRNL
jgi:hypothetical protein